MTNAEARCNKSLRPRKPESVSGDSSVSSEPVWPSGKALGW